MAWEQIAVHDEVTLHHDVVDGLSTYWVANGGPFRAVLVFRVGMADETLPTRGICHLVEHLAIEPQPRLYAHNGWCSIDATGFWAEGDRDEVLEYLSGVAQSAASASARPDGRRAPDPRDGGQSAGRVDRHHAPQLPLGCADVRHGQLRRVRVVPH